MTELGTTLLVSGAKPIMTQSALDKRRLASCYLQDRPEQIMGDW